jgi:PhnB protein
MLLDPYLLFKGNARAALTFYQKVLNIEIGHHQTYGDSPAQTEPRHNEWLIYGELLYNGSCFAMLADSPMATIENNSAIHLSLNFENEKKNTMPLII